MHTVKMPGLAREVSALCLGTADVPSYDDAAPLYDAFVEAGGTIFDTAWIYGLGRAETLFGQWLKARGNRTDLVVIAKGAHTPECTPQAIGAQLDQSLERLGIETADIYMMHRDDPAVPVGEFVDAIAREVNAGRVNAYGFSNWPLDRLDAAIAYANEHGLKAPTALSNNFSLAEMVEPVWDGCIHSSDAASIARLANGDVGLFAWSSQARGYFVRDDDDPELRRCWRSSANEARKARAQELAAKYGVSGNAIALAYCLNQSFPIIPLIGPLKPDELTSSLTALEVKLTSDELAWLTA